MQLCQPVHRHCELSDLGSVKSNGTLPQKESDLSRVTARLWELFKKHEHQGKARFCHEIVSSE